MSSTTTSQVLGQSATVFAPTAHVQADFYAKLARLKQDVLAGRHPRHSLPAQIIEQFHLVQATDTQASQHTPNVPNGITAAKTQNQQPWQQQQTQQTTVKPTISTTNSALTQTQPFRPLPPKPSAIDPVLLTKSYDLVKAENHLKRLRIEKQLKEEAQSKKTRSGELDNNGWNGAHTFDCDQVLTAALSRVKPVSGLHVPPVNNDRPASSTPNTNSYYSSQAWSPEQERENQRRELEAGGDVSAYSSYEDSGAEHVQRQARVSGLGPPAQQQYRQSAIIEVSRDDSYSPPSADSFIPTRPRGRESESYSPPPVVQGSHQAVQPNPSYAGQNGRQAVRGNPNQKHAPNISNGRSNGKEKKKERLAAKAATRQMQNDRIPSNMHPPPTSAPIPAPVPAPAPAQKINERKRKRGNEIPQPTANATQRLDSPVPYIKPEPVSPPPLSIPARPLTDAPRRLVFREDGTADIQIDAPPPDTPPPTARRRINRDDSDLRRVASLQHARRAPATSPGQQPTDVFYDQDVPMSSLPPQQTSRPRYYQEEPAMASPRVVRTRRTSPEFVEAEYSPREIMPPPPLMHPQSKRVFDQYGNEYVAIPASSSARQPIMLEPEYLDSPRRDRQTSFFEQPASYHQHQLPQQIYAPAPRHIARPPPEVIEIDDFEESQMARPRLVTRRQRFVSGDGYMHQQPVYYEPQPQTMPSAVAQRSVSMQPFPSSSHQQYRIAPPESPYVQHQPQQHQHLHSRQPMEMQPMYERPVSARPNLASQGGYVTSPTYGSTHGNPYNGRNGYQLM